MQPQDLQTATSAGLNALQLEIGSYGIPSTASATASNGPNSRSLTLSSGFSVTYDSLFGSDRDDEEDGGLERIVSTPPTSLASSTSSTIDTSTNILSNDLAASSVDSIASVRSMLLGPSFGTLNMSIRDLVFYLQSRRRLSGTRILSMSTYRSKALIEHMFVVFHIKQGSQKCWLRMDRRAEEPRSIRFVFGGLSGPAQDTVRM
jgi:hypothetical protein